MGTKFNARFLLAATTGCLAMVMVFAQPAQAQDVVGGDIQDGAVTTLEILDGTI